MAAKLTIDNEQALTGAIDALSQIASESVLRQATVAAARVIFDEVKLRAPVGKGSEGKSGGHPSGFLRDSILIAYDKEKSAEGLRASYLITWSKDAFYGRFLEFGTSKMAARPFLRPAYEAKKQEAADKFSQVIDEKVKELSSG